MLHILVRLLTVFVDGVEKGGGRQYRDSSISFEDLEMGIPGDDVVDIAGDRALEDFVVVRIVLNHLQIDVRSDHLRDGEHLLDDRVDPFIEKVQIGRAHV